MVAVKHIHIHSDRTDREMAIQLIQRYIAISLSVELKPTVTACTALLNYIDT